MDLINTEKLIQMISNIFNNKNFLFIKRKEFENDTRFRSL